MPVTQRKGDLGEAMIIAEVTRRGYRVALPISEDCPFDIIVLREGRLERVQCKYTESNGRTVVLKCRSTNNWNNRKYTADELDWLAVYDKTSNRCFFLPASLLGKGRATINLRLSAPRNGQKKRTRLASDYTDF